MSNYNKDKSNDDSFFCVFEDFSGLDIFPPGLKVSQEEKSTPMIGLTANSLISVGTFSVNTHQHYLL